MIRLIVAIFAVCWAFGFANAKVGLLDSGTATVVCAGIGGAMAWAWASRKVQKGARDV